LACALAALILLRPAAAESPHDVAAGVQLQGDYRLRYEALDPQFRSGYSGRDQALSMRGRLRLDVPFQRGSLTAEIMDSRATLNDDGSPVYTSTVNTLEIIQALATLELAPAAPDRRNTLSVGIMTKDLGSRRLIARNRFRNTVNTFAGLDWQWSGADGQLVEAFYFSPLRRLPEDREALLDNDRQTDEISRDTLLAGVFLRWPISADGTRAEILAVRSSGPEARVEVDASADLSTVDLRLLRKPVAAGWDFEIELALQRGKSREPGSAEKGRHSAFFTHLSAGYTLAGPKRLRLAVEYNYASGDRDAFDSETERFDYLYGSRRFDFGPTGIYGPIARSNLEALGLRSTAQISPSVTMLLAYQHYELASATDAWIVAGLRDPSGGSGRSLGRQLEYAFTWDVIPQRLTLELGSAYLRYGSFARNAPDASGNSHSVYAYGQLLTRFGKRQ